MKITEIQFTNYKAFYGDGETNKIKIPEGRNLLIYGENGSGKSSIYEGLRNLFLASNVTEGKAHFSRHLAVDEFMNDPADNTKQIQQAANIKITLNDFKGTFKQVIYGTPNGNVENDNDILDASKSNSFLSYRELLKTYLINDINDGFKFQTNLAEIIIKDILAQTINSGTNSTYIKNYNELWVAGKGTKPNRAEKEKIIKKFDVGLKKDIGDINIILNELLHYFFPDLKIELSVQDSYIDYDSQNYPVFQVALKCWHFGIDTSKNDENHLTILNEARLSALALCIYLSGVIIRSKQYTKIKFLLFDDIFIGLDTSNRIPLLKILNEYRVIEWKEDINPTTGKLENIIQRNADGTIKHKLIPFFDDYQIFITTYDRFWFNVAKSFFETKVPNTWHFLELFSNKKLNNQFETPVVYSSLNYLEKADYYYLTHDYPSCANHLRKALEKKIKELLPLNKHYAESVDSETGITEVKKLKTLNQYLEKFITYCDENGIDAKELTDLKNLKDWYFNPFSHDNIGTPIFKRELDNAKSLVEKLENFEFKILLEAGKHLYFRFNDDKGQTREYKIILIENLRWIKSTYGNLLTNPLINCYEWTKNNQTENVEWNNKSLIGFYNNKLNHFQGISDSKVEMPVLWAEIYELEHGMALNELIV